MSKNLKEGLVGVIMLLVIVGAYVYPRQSPQLAGASPAGSTFTTSKEASVVYLPATSAASSTSILNTDANNRFITSGTVACFGTNGQGGTFTVATTTIPNLGLQGNTNYAENIVATTTTSSLLMYTASSTEGVLTYTSRVWPAGVYETVVDSAVTGASCTISLHYVPS